MGTYLSKPVLDKRTEDGEDLSDTYPVSWGVVDMQGWRKSMEDAHIAQPIVTPPSNFKSATNDASEEPVRVFAVFDGHGGAEVARFCQLHLVNVLTSQEEWNAETVDVGKALVTTFHSIDRLIDDPSRRDEINRLKTEMPSTMDAYTPSPKLADEINEKKEGDFHDEKKSEVLNTSLATSVDNNSYTSHNSSQTEDVKKKADEEDDSNDAVGEIEEDRLDVLEDSDDNEDDGVGLNLSSEDTISLFKKFLSISQQGNAPIPLSDGTPNAEKQVDNSEGIVPTRILNGRQVCNLPDHPVHAGCTSICAVMIGQTLTVANAGDSRSVLCRKGGATEPMSFDHKPSNEIEKKRIAEAGGFVNQFGRVNGNLNLSRSIGDLKYKQVPGIPPAAQMITAEPDIRQVTLDPEDEFLILACDGIWDCLTNEEAVKYVRDRIDAKTPTEIGTEMLNEIISNDPRETQGIGGDNMTIMIIDFLPGSRSHRRVIIA